MGQNINSFGCYYQIEYKNKISNNINNDNVCGIEIFGQFKFKILNQWFYIKIKHE